MVKGIDLDFIKEKFLTEDAVIEFADGKKLCHNELIGAYPQIKGGGVFPEIWYKICEKKVYVLNISPEKKDFRINIGAYFAGDDILYHDVYTGMVYKPENGVINLRLDSYDMVCLNPNSLLFRPEYDYREGTHL